MNIAFNKFGNVEIEASILKYRISIQELGIQDSLELEKEIKRKLQEVENDNHFIVPFDIQVVNRYMILYFNFKHFASMDYLRELPLLDKIPYFLSLVTLAKEQEKGLNISWDRFNFVVDKHEQMIKVFLFETDSLKIYDVPDDLLKRVQDLIVSTMTSLSVFINLPKRHDFIDASEENIEFVENVYRMKSLDDLSMYMETISLDIEQAKSYEDETTEERQEVKKKKISFTLPAKNQKKEKLVKPKRKNNVVQHRNTKKKNSGINMKLLFVVFGIFMTLYMIHPLLLPTTDAGEVAVVSDVTKTKSETFQGSTEFDTSLVEVYRNAYNSNYQDAYNILITIEKKELKEADVALLIEVYEKTNNLSVLLDEAPSVSNDVITYLYTRNKLNRLPELVQGMTTINAYIEFEKAYMTQDYEYMLSFLPDVAINGRKEQQIIEAYLALHRIEEAKKFAESVGNPDLIKRVEDYRY